MFDRNQRLFTLITDNQILTRLIFLTLLFLSNMFVTQICAETPVAKDHILAFD